MEIDVELQQKIDNAMTNRRGIWVMNADGIVADAIIEQNDGEVLVPELLAVLRLVTAFKNDDDQVSTMEHTLFLRQTNLMQLIECLVEMGAAMLMPELTEVTETWTRGKEDHNEL
jgi:hypothetical protein